MSLVVSSYKRGHHHKTSSKRKTCSRVVYQNKKSKKRNTFLLLSRSLLPTKVFGTPPRKSFCLCISLPAGSPVNTSFQMQSAKRLSRLIWNFKLIISVAHDSSPYGANSAQKNPTKRRRRPWGKKEEEDSLKWHHLRYQVKNIFQKGGTSTYFFRESTNDIDLCTFNKKDMKFQAHYLKGRVPRLLLKRGRPAALTGANSFYQKKILH